MKDKHKNKNSGFTLVEIIVVVVILAIIIGVAITGIYKYVQEARVNTDENNLNTTNTMMSTFYLTDDEKKFFKNEAWSVTPIEEYEYYNYLALFWTDGMTLDESYTSTKNGGEAGIDWDYFGPHLPTIQSKFSELFSEDGMPPIKGATYGCIILGYDNNDNWVVHSFTLDNTLKIQSGYSKGLYLYEYIDNTFKKQS